MARRPRPSTQNLRTPIPDRPLEPPAEIPTVAVRAPGNHPFVYRKMVIGPVGAMRPADGDLVRVVDRDHLPLGFGLWNSRSQISLRLLLPGVSAPGVEFWKERLGRAIELRRETLTLETVTNAYRVVHAEGDGLSGLVVDRFDDVLSIETFSLGIYQRIGPILAERPRMAPPPPPLRDGPFPDSVVDERTASRRISPVVRSRARTSHRESRSRSMAFGSACSLKEVTRPASFAINATIAWD